MMLRKFRELLLSNSNGAHAIGDGKATPDTVKAASLLMARHLEKAGLIHRYVLNHTAAAAVMQIQARGVLPEAQGAIQAPNSTCWFEMPPDAEGFTFGLLWIGDETRDPLRQGAAFVVNYRPHNEFPIVVPCPVDLDKPLAVEPAEAEDGVQLDKLNEGVAQAVPYITAWLLSCWALVNTPLLTHRNSVDFRRVNRQLISKGALPILGFVEVGLTGEYVEFLDPEQPKEGFVFSFGMDERGAACLVKMAPSGLSFNVFIG